MTPYERLLDLVPTYLLRRDDESGDGPLRALLSVVAGEIDILERDLDRLGEGAFIETCAEWLVPYLADLVGLAEVPPPLGTTVSRRALVANTVAYRHRKGTVAVLEQVARDVTGWPVRAVEYHPLLAATGHVNHVRLDRAAVASLRAAARLERAAVTAPPGPRGALDPLLRTAEIRRIESGRGRHGVGRVGVFLFATQAFEVGAARTDVPNGVNGGWARARPVGAEWTFDPLGRPTPLFGQMRREERIEHLADEDDLPLPLRPRRLLALLRAAREGLLPPQALPLAVRVGATAADLTPTRIRVCHLENLAPGPGPQVMVDAVAGRLSVHGATPSDVFVRHSYGALAELGAGTYDRSAGHDAILAADRYVPMDVGAVPEPDAPPAAGQTEVRSGSDAPAGSVATVSAALALAEASWAATGSTTKGHTYVVSVGDSATYAGDLVVDVPVATRLVLVAAEWPMRRLPNGDVAAPVPGRYATNGLRPHIQGNLTITGGPGSSVVIDGLLLEGDVIIGPGALDTLAVAHTTVTGGLRVESAQGAANNGLDIRVSRSVLARVTLADTVPAFAASDSIIDARSGTAIAGAAAHIALEGVTVVGAIEVRTFDASSCVLDGPVTVEHRQIGCVRFSYVAPGSRTPRRYRSVPAAEGESGPAPVYAATDAGSPAYLALAPTCPAAIRGCGEDGAEPGAYNHLHGSPRAHAARRQLDQYLPVGIGLGIFGS